MRVIGGKWKSRKINSLYKASYNPFIRPTADRVKENIFNILENLEAGNPILGARVLDIFCGTGAMGIEAISRGASFCSFIDYSLISKQITEENINILCCKKETKFLLRNSMNLGVCPYEKYNLIFLDPPYKKNLLSKTIQNLCKFGWIDKNAILIVEKDKDEEFNFKLQLIDNRIYGNTEILFLKI